MPQLSMKAEAMERRTSSVKVPAFAAAASPSSRPSVTAENLSVLAMSFILCRMGLKIERALFCIEVHIWPHVMGMDSKAALVSSAAPNSASFTTSAVTAPFSA